MSSADEPRTWAGLMFLVMDGENAADATLRSMRPRTVSGIPDAGWDGAKQQQIVRFVPFDLDE